MSMIMSTILSTIRITFIISFPISTAYLHRFTVQLVMALADANPAGCAVFLDNLYTAVWEGNA